MTEEQVIYHVCELVERRKIRVPNPNYLVTKLYSPQWKILGLLIYYQLPDKTIVAYYNQLTRVGRFSEKGLRL